MSEHLSTPKIVDIAPMEEVKTAPEKPVEKECRTEPAGLKNLLNTCYANSTLQVLAASNRFLSQLETRQQGRVTTNLKKLIKNMSTSKRTCSPVRVLRPFWSRFRRGHQHDALDFLRSMICRLEEEEKPTPKRGKKGALAPPAPAPASTPVPPAPSIRQLFWGRLHYTRTCLSCSRSFSTEEDFLDLSLPFPDLGPKQLVAGGSQLAVQKAASRHSREDDDKDEDEGESGDEREAVVELLGLEGLIQHFLRPELLVGENRFSCESCGLQDGLRRAAITRPPPILILSVNHFKFHRDAFVKIDKGVSVPDLLSLPVEDKTPEAGQGACFHVVQYALLGMIVHRGFSVEFGHYYAIRRYRAQAGPDGDSGDGAQAWYRCNDDNVSSISPRSSGYKEDTPYGLLYEKTDLVRPWPNCRHHAASQLQDAASPTERYVLCCPVSVRRSEARSRRRRRLEALTTFTGLRDPRARAGSRRTDPTTSSAVSPVQPDVAASSDAKSQELAKASKNGQGASQENVLSPEDAREPRNTKRRGRNSKTTARRSAAPLPRSAGSPVPELPDDVFLSRRKKLKASGRGRPDRGVPSPPPPPPRVGPCLASGEGAHEKVCPSSLAGPGHPLPPGIPRYRCEAMGRREASRQLRATGPASSAGGKNVEDGSSLPAQSFATLASKLDLVPVPSCRKPGKSTRLSRKADISPECARNAPQGNPGFLGRQQGCLKKERRGGRKRRRLAKPMASLSPSDSSSAEFPSGSTQPPQSPARKRQRAARFPESPSEDRFTPPLPPPPTTPKVWDSEDGEAAGSMTYEEKEQLKEELNNLHGDEAAMDQVVDIILSRQPSLQEEPPDTPEIELDILQPATLRALQAYVRSLKEAASKHVLYCGGDLREETGGRGSEDEQEPGIRAQPVPNRGKSSPSQAIQDVLLPGPESTHCQHGEDKGDEDEEEEAEAPLQHPCGKWRSLSGKTVRRLLSSESESEQQ